MSPVDAAGSAVSSGSGAACLGDPVASLVWLARATHQFGDPPRAGEVIVSGELGWMVPVSPGDQFGAALSGRGTVRASFTTHTLGATP